jgi:VWFA-related protein
VWRQLLFHDRRRLKPSPSKEIAWRARALALAALAITTLSAQQPAPFVSRSTLVVVPATVLDKKGVAIGGLLQEDFEVFEDGKPVVVTTFVPANDPVAAGSESGRFIVIVLDDMRIEAERVWKVKDIAKQFASLMTPRDIVSVIKMNGGKATTSNSKSEVMAAIDKFSIHAMAGERELQLDSIHALDTIGDLADQLSKATHRRKVMVVISNPRVFSPVLPDWPSLTDPVPEYPPEWQHAIRETSRNNVSVYVMDPQGMPGGFIGDRYDAARSFAAETGGEALVNTNNVKKVVDRIWQDAGSYYLLGYAPTLDDGKAHRIEVKVKRPDVQIRARRSRG